jgi:hypothetical protein
MPASISTLFWMGAVTSAAKAPVAQASDARCSMASTLWALDGSGRPGVTGAANGWSQTSMRPSAGANAEGA